VFARALEQFLLAERYASLWQTNKDNGDAKYCFWQAVEKRLVRRVEARGLQDFLTDRHAL